jgi:hypothetical protein
MGWVCRSYGVGGNTGFSGEALGKRLLRKKIWGITVPLSSGSTIHENSRYMTAVFTRTGSECVADWRNGDDESFTVYNDS